MATAIKFNATKRVAKGSGEARRVRREGGLPAALTRIDHATETLKLSTHEFVMAMRNEANEQILVELNVDGVSIHALLREIQRDVIDSSPIHVDFSEVDMSKKIRAQIRITLSGEADGVKNQGGVLTQSAHEIEVECLPTKLIETYDVNIDSLKLGEVFTVADLKLGDDYIVLTAPETPIAAVSEVKDEAAAGDAAAAPEVMSKGKKEEAPAAKAKK